MVVSIALPMPFILIFLANGRQVGLISVAFLFILLYYLAGSSQAYIFLGEFAVMAILLAETIRIHFTFDKCIFVSAVGSTFVSLVLLFAIHGAGEKSVTDFFEEQINKSIEQSLGSIKEMGDKEMDPATIKKFAEESARKFAPAYPAFLGVGSMFTAMVNYFLVLFIWTRYYGRGLALSKDFARWILPDNFIWPLILSAPGAFFAGGALQVVALNLFILLFMIYFLQGIVIVVHFLQTKQVPVIFWVIAFVLIFTQPVFMGLVGGMGVFDLWVDFRKIRKITPKIPEE